MEGDDRISCLPDAVLGEIVSLLRTKEGGRTQAIASRWRHIWRSGPLNLDLHDGPPIKRRITLAEVSGILSSHRGPGRRFSVPRQYFVNDAHPAATLDAWLCSPALDGLQELDCHYGSMWYSRRRSWGPRPPLPPSPPLPASVRRFSSTLRVASFGGCGFPDENSVRDLHFPVLKQLSLMSVQISESSLYALLAACPVLQSLMLTQSIGCPHIRIVSRTLRSIGLDAAWGDIMLDHLIIEDTPFLERLLLLGHGFREGMVISVISAPKLKVLGQLPVIRPILKFDTSFFFDTSVFKGSFVVNSQLVVHSVKVLALTHINLSLDKVIAFMKCFPCLENLYIKMSNIYSRLTPEVTNEWRHKYQSLMGTLDIRLKKIVLSTYLGNQAHVNFAGFFVSNARVLESMVLEVDVSNYYNKAWIERQHTLLQTKDRASRGARFDFVSHPCRPVSYDHIWYEQAHDLSTADPFVGFDYWATG